MCRGTALQAVRMRWSSFADGLQPSDGTAAGGLGGLDLQFYLAQEPLLHGPRFTADASAAGLGQPAAPLLAPLAADLSIPGFVPWGAAGVSANLWLAGGAVSPPSPLGHAAPGAVRLTGAAPLFDMPDRADQFGAALRRLPQPALRGLSPHAHTHTILPPLPLLSRNHCRPRATVFLTLAHSTADPWV